MHRWCGPCKAIAPAFKQLAEDYPNCTFLRVDVDQRRPIAAKYEVCDKLMESAKQSLHPLQGPVLD